MGEWEEWGEGGGGKEWESFESTCIFQAWIKTGCSYNTVTLHYGLTITAPPRRVMGIAYSDGSTEKNLEA